MTDRAGMQEEEYGFPYHYLPHVEAGGASNLRFLRWGLEYACYMEHVAHLVRGLGPVSHLDVGCGDARLFHLTRGGAQRRVGVDFSARALAYARGFNPDAEFHADLAALRGQAFDLVSAVEVLEHIPDVELTGFLARLWAHTRPGGHLLLSVPSTAQPLHPKHYRHYDAGLLADQVAVACPHLETVRVDSVYRGSRLVDAYARWTLNRWWVVEVAPLRRLVWAYVWSRLRLAPPGQGRHVVGLFRRTLD